MKIIGISGKKRSGKDTVAALIKERFPRSVIYHFAGPLKKEVSRAIGYSLDHLEKNKPSFRTLLQGWGDYRKNLYGEDFYVKLADEALIQLNMFEIVIIPDLRFKCEFNWINRMHGITIRVNRLGTSEDTHRSEIELDNETFDYVIENNGTLSQLLESVKALPL